VSGSFQEEAESRNLESGRTIWVREGFFFWMIMKSVGARAGDLLTGMESVMCCAACARNRKAGEVSRVDVDLGIVDVAHVLLLAWVVLWCRCCGALVSGGGGVVRRSGGGNLALKVCAHPVASVRSIGVGSMLHTSMLMLYAPCCCCRRH